MFLSCGDVLFDLFAQSTSSVGSIQLAGPVGGSPMNVANGLARLGNRSAFLCKNSDDLFGQRIRSFLEENRIITDWVVPTSLNSTLAIVQKEASGAANYAFYINQTADISLTSDELPTQLPDELVAVHVGSYCTAVDPVASSLLTLVQREQSARFISYDPNVRPTVEPDLDLWRSRFRSFAACADLVKASDEDIESLYGSSTDIDAFASEVLGMGAKLVCVTQGQGGGVAFSADGREAHLPGLTVDVVDTVGAGDTFQAATLHWLNAQGLIRDGSLTSSEVDLDALLRFAMTAAAITCTREGADLPGLADIEALIGG